MKRNQLQNKKGMKMMAVMALWAVLLAGCGQGDAEDGRDTIVSADRTGVTEAQRPEDTAGTKGTADAEGTSGTENQDSQNQTAETGSTQLEVRFGDNGKAFMMTLLDNETAAAIARYVGTSDWRLPIYERNDDVDYSVLQYYDIPSRYDIPSDNPETVTEAKAGDVFYSDPNRIVLFYHDAEISAEYTKIGTFDATEEFVTAVEENPVLEGWGNKIIQISQP
jgi:hypothetical protein